MKNSKESIYIMVIGYQAEQDEYGVILDIVDTIEEAEVNDNQYHENYAYTDFVECLRMGEELSSEDGEYNIGDKYYFD